MSIKILLPCVATLFVVAGMVTAQQEGPLKAPGATVAKKKPSADGEGKPEEELPKIPSKLKKDPAKTPSGDVAQFKSDVDIVTLDVAVVDNKGNFIPGVPPGNFRLLEDNVPQQISSFNLGEAPMTVCMVIEFSNRFQQYWTSTWYQTLSASYGFLETLKPEDYVAVVAYDMRSEILSSSSACAL